MKEGRFNINNNWSAEEKNVKRLFHNAPTLVAILKGRAGTCELFNEMFSKLWAGRDVINKTMREAWPELEGQGWFEIVEQVYDTGQPAYGYEKSAFADWDGNGHPKELFFNFVYSPSFSDEGTVDGVMIFGFDVTQQVIARKKVEESESYFRRLADTVPAILWITETDGPCSYLNQGWYNETGQTPKEALGFGWLKATHPDDSTEAANVFADANSKQTPFNILYRLRRKNGEYRWAVDSGCPRYDNTGKFEGFIGCVTDVHEQIISEQNKKQIEGRYRSMYEGAPVSFWVEDFTAIRKEVYRLAEQGIEDLSAYFASCPEELNDLIRSVIVKDVNQTTLSLLEAETKEDLKKGLSQIFIEDTRVAFIGELQLIREGGGVFRYETVLQTLKRNRIEVVVHINFPYDEDYSSVLVTLIDITVEKKAEAALKLSEERFRILANTIPQVVWTTLPSGEMEYLSNQWEKITGQPAEHALQTGFEPFIHPDDMSAVHEKWKVSMENGKAWQAEYRLKNFANNTYRWFQGHTVPLKDQNSNIVKWIGAATDIQSLKEYSQTLEHEVAQRTSELQQSNASLQQFAHVASHDLKEPLRKIKTFARRLRDEAESLLPASSRIYLEKIDRAAERMMSMVDGVLNYSTIDTLNQAREKVDLNGVISNIEYDLELSIQNKNAVLKYAELPTIDGVPILIFQLFYNLVNNCLKFKHHQRDLVINISSSILTKGSNRYFHIIVKDNGIGFDNIHAKKIFDTFVRLHSKDKYEGTGLGLSLCKKIVQQHNGTIWAWGEQNIGAEFHVELPVN